MMERSMKDSNLQNTQMKRLVHQFLVSHVNKGKYPGAVAALWKRGQYEVIEAYGWLGAESRQPISTEALFSLESISKVICTAPLVLSLSECNKMSLDEPLSTWIPEFRNHAKKSITPRQILSHASGLPEVDDLSLNPALSCDELWESILNCTPLFEPGKKVSYSDLGYMILGRAIEIATGQDLDNLAKSKLWHPLEMKDTTFNPCATKQMTSNRGICGKSVDPIDQALGGIVGCDGVFSTAGDLLNFGKMMLNGGILNGKQVLNEASIREITQNQTPFQSQSEGISSAFDYLLFAPKALGWELPGPYSHGSHLFSKRSYGKVGGTGTFIWLDPDQELIAIYLTNHGQPVPFSKSGWEDLIQNVEPKEFFDLAFL